MRNNQQAQKKTVHVWSAGRAALLAFGSPLSHMFFFSGVGALLLLTAPAFMQGSVGPIWTRVRPLVSLVSHQKHSHRVHCFLFISELAFFPRGYQVPSSKCSESVTLAPARFG